MIVASTAQLVAWIRELEATDKLYKFYKSRQWLDLRARVLEQDHFECVECRERGKYSRAVTVHHVNEVLVRPELALQEFFVDENGEQQRNLLSLCMKCHNDKHHRFYGNVPKVQLNEERW